MHPRRKKRLIVVAAIVCGVALAASLTLTALNQNINLFYSPSHIISGEVPDNTTIRIGGMVVMNSVSRSESSLDVSFDLTDTAETVSVIYSGILPDLFREGQGIVAMGKLNGNKFIASEVLAKHDETYMSPEVSEALKAANKQLHDKKATSNSTEP